ncbi:nucleotidyltransferase domain-containing protein [Clostridium sp. LY3-2]|uniref:nucleotidyltransferase domain-containing protein n=1 Tax=Clostridium sp. LY3-2 TaxID=2942482 RepID=UPI0021526BA4|nr:nucleotidyltransferase domain-containing protein [Clostridium sp. LY3-2]MCR6513433.1 nucleotidyltransferase domain-containing protein [Clostridium sp. LY3-2]
MKEVIVNYQTAFNKILSDLSSNENVISVFAFGSIVTGDIWEGSDIDLFVVYKNEFGKVKHLHSEVFDIAVHMKVLSKDSFLYSYLNEGKNSIASKILKKSKLVLSRDNEIKDVYNKSKYIFDDRNEEDNMLYLGVLLKEIGVCKKYLSNEGICTAFEVLIKALNNYAKLYLNVNGYRETKDAISMVMNLDKVFEKCILLLIENEITSKEIERVIRYLEYYINDNIVTIAGPIIKEIRESKEPMSTSEIQDALYPFGEKIKMQFILKELSELGIINKKFRETKDSSGSVIISEVVYSCR